MVHRERDELAHSHNYEFALKTSFLKVEQNLNGYIFLADFFWESWEIFSSYFPKKLFFEFPI